MWRLLRAAACLLAAVGAGPAQVKLTLQQAGSRSGPDFEPAYENQEVSVTAQVSGKPLWVFDSYYVPIQDDKYYGLLLRGTAEQFENLSPGEWVEARGTISKRAGLPVLLLAGIRPLRTGSPPVPKKVQVADIAGFRYLGVLVTVEDRVAAVGENRGGRVLSIGDQGKFVTIFLPNARREPAVGLSGFNIGDLVRATGIATQYDPLPPYDGSFQILIPDTAAVVLLNRTSILPSLLLTALAAVGLVLALWWLRESRMAAQRRMLRLLNSLGEEIVAASSPGEILKRLGAVMPRVSGATGVRLYVYNRRTKALDRIPEPSDTDAVSIPLDTPLGGLAEAACVCFRNRTLLNIPDTRRSPFINKTARTVELSRSVLFVPMFAQNELLGVLEVGHSGGVRYFTQEEQAATQHLANQVATSLKLQDRQSMREQLFRSEKLAATGQLISGVANELRAPLESIRKLAGALLTRNADTGLGRDLRVLAAEAQRAADIVTRLVSFGRASETDAKLVEVNDLLAGLMQFRAREWTTLGVTVHNLLAREPLYVLGAQGQLEEVFLNLLVHAEQSVLEAPAKEIAVSSGILANRLLVEIGYAARPAESPGEDPFCEEHPETGAMRLEVCRGIVQSHGGEIRFLHTEASRSQFQVELPLAHEERTPAPRLEPTKSQRQLTILVVEPEAAVQRQLVGLLGAKGHRVVPIVSAEEGVEMAQRLHFDVAFCSARLPGLNWVEFFERVRADLGSFVLVTEGFDSDLSRAFHGGEGLLLSKPIQEAEVDRLLAVVKARLEANAAVKSGR